jgi:hypothetical protein
MNTYADRYINHADIPETRARKRRWREFLAESHLQEVLNKESSKHQEICKLVEKKIEGRLDHVTFLELGHMAVVLTETYRSHLQDFDCDELYVVEVPANNAPYCGSRNEAVGAKPGTKSFLITTRLKKRQLDEVLQRLKQAAEKLPPGIILRRTANEP